MEADITHAMQQALMLARIRGDAEIEFGDGLSVVAVGLADAAGFAVLVRGASKLRPATEQELDDAGFPYSGTVEVALSTYAGPAAWTPWY